MFRKQNKMITQKYKEKNMSEHQMLSALILPMGLVGFPGGSDGEESACIVGDPDSIPGLGKSPGEGNGSSLLAWRIPWTEEPVGQCSWDHKESG